jgi:Na+-translocating ferredoxin:NAD+ oxidoreductase RnfC subunit
VRSRCGAPLLALWTVFDEPGAMAPRALESREQFIARLRRADVARSPLRFGGHHFSHVVDVEAGVWRVRRLVLDRAKADAYLAKHGMFMPEHAETLSEPGPVVLQAGSLEQLITLLQAANWPMW